jgi:dTDP-4-amino-4,6-dideoxygalactose transaminase
MTQTTEIKQFKVEVGCFDANYGNAKKYVNQALDNSRLSYGPFTQRFEKEMAEAHDSRHAIMSNSGTDALRLAIIALKEVDGWKDGDEVIVPALTFVATSNVVLQSNLTPVFVDVEKDTYNLDPKLIEAAITPRTRAIMPVHLFGMPCDMDPIMAIAKKHKLRVVEDTCETMFARYKGKAVGSFGDVGCFSTYVAHLLVTGVGGLSMTSNDNLAVIMRSLMNHGRDSIYVKMEDSNKATAEERRMVMDRRFSFVRLGYSARVTELEAAIGCAQFERWQEIISARQANAAVLSKLLAPYANRIQLPSVPSDRDHVFMMYPVVVRPDAGFSRDDLTHFLEENGIETRTMVPLLNQPIYKKLFGEKFEDSFPVAKWVNSSGFYMGTHQKLGASDMEYVAQKFGEFLKKN